MAIPVTEVPSERAFSVAGFTVTKLGASLDQDNVDNIILLLKTRWHGANLFQPIKGFHFLRLYPIK